MATARKQVDELIPTRESLLIRLKDWNDDVSWRDFFETYWRLIYGAALKAGLTDAEAQDVVQEVVVAVAKKIAEFKYDPARGSFKGWLLKLTQWRVKDQFRKRMTQHVSASSETNLVEGIPDQASAELLERIWEEEWHSNLMGRATELVKARVSPRRYQMFQLNVRQGWPARKAAAALGVSCAQIYVAKHQVSGLLKKEIHRLQKKVF